MSLMRKLITSTYFLRMKLCRITGMGIRIYENKSMIKASENCYTMTATLNTGEEISFERYRGKKLLVVNLASHCGYTPQYKELETLHQANKEIVVLGFPSNNFGAQEPGTDEGIAEFCKTNFNITFSLFKKNNVKGNSKQPVYRWLTDKNKNGWNNLEPRWNFYKYLIDENGNLSKIFSSAVSPMDIQL